MAEKTEKPKVQNTDLNKNRTALKNLSQRVEEKGREVATKLGGKGKEVLESLARFKEQLAESELGDFFKQGMAILLSLGVLGSDDSEKDKTQIAKKGSPNSSVSYNPLTNNALQGKQSERPPQNQGENEKVHGPKNNEKEISGIYQANLDQIKGPDTTRGQKGRELLANHQFRNKLILIANQLQVPVQALIRVIELESGGNPKAKNGDSGATGLIQFMPKTAEGMGTTVNAISNMTGLEQLDLVYKFYEKYTGKLNGVGELYMVTFYPYALNKGDDFILGSEKSLARAEKIAAQNKGIVKYGKNPKFITREGFMKYAMGGKKSKLDVDFDEKYGHLHKKGTPAIS